MAARRKGRRALPLGHKPRGRQRVQHRRAQHVQHGPTAQQSIVGTQTVTPPRVFSSAAGGAGYRTLETPPLARAPVQPFTLGFYAPFAVGGATFGRATPEVPFSNSAAGQASPYSSSTPQPAPKSTTPARSTVFPAPR
jgi:hypothetical protein